MIGNGLINRTVFLFAILFLFGSAFSEWYRGNTHTHTVLSGHGEWQPGIVAKWFYDHGYDFLTLTEHNHFIDPDTIPPTWGNDFILVPGEEVTGNIHVSAVNINGLVGSNIYGFTGNTRSATIKHFVDGIEAENGIAILNHPNFSGVIPFSEMDLVDYLRLFELYNGHPSVRNDGAAGVISTEAIWDSLLTRGHRIYGVASDDSHTYTYGTSRAGRGWVMVESSVLNPDSIENSLQEGNFYSSRGVMLKDISINNWMLSIEADKIETDKVLDTAVTPYIIGQPVSGSTEGFEIHFIGPGGEVLAKVGGESGSFQVTNRLDYVRAKIIYTVNKNNSLEEYYAWTQPVFTDMRDGSDTTGLGAASVDNTSPLIIQAESKNSDIIRITFNETVSTLSAEKIENYSIDNGIQVISATLLGDQKTVELTTSQLVEIEYEITINDVFDLADTPNKIATDSKIKFTHKNLLINSSFDNPLSSEWKVVDEGTINGPTSNWNVTGGDLCQTSNIHGPTSTSEDNRKGTFIYFDDGISPNWKDYNVDMNFISGDNDGVGIMFRYQDPNNYYKLDVDQQRNWSKLFKMQNGVETLLREESRSYTVSSVTSINIVADGNDIKASLNGTDLFGGTLQDSDLQTGTVALYTWGNDNVCFNDLVVTPLNLPVNIVSPREIVENINLLQSNSGKIFITIPSNNHSQYAQLQFFNVSGNLLWSKNFITTTGQKRIVIDKRELKSKTPNNTGLYFIKINWGSGDIFQKFVLE